MTAATGEQSANDESGTFWNRHYQTHVRPWSGDANYVLVDTIQHLAPGRALDLGCGEGGDAVWLASKGWRVTAVDVSSTVIDRVARLAATFEVADRVAPEQHHLAHTFPNGAFDLVTAFFLHSPVDFPREQILRRAACAVARGGLLLIMDHGSVAPWSWNQDPDTAFPSPEDMLASLDLNPDAWRTERLESIAREATGPEGATATVIDNVVAVRRLP